MLMLIIPIASAGICSLEPVKPNIQCTMLTPSTTSTTYQTFNESAHLVDSGSLASFNDSIKYWNFTQPVGSYISILDDNSTRETVVGFKEETMASSWIAIILALSLMTIIFSYFAVHIREKKLQTLRSFLFLLSLSNACIVGFTTWIISNNPADTTAFTPVATVWMSANLLVLMFIVWLYSFYLLDRGLDKVQ